MDELSLLWQEIDRTPVDCVPGELSKASACCGFLLPQLSARLRLPSKRFLPIRFRHTLELMEEVDVAREALVALQRLLVAVLERLSTDADSLLKHSQVCMTLESLVARVLRIPRLHVRVLAKGTVAKKAPFTKQHTRRLLQLLRALEAPQLCDSSDVWVADTRHLRQLVTLLRAGVTAPSSLQESLRVQPLRRTLRLLSQVPSCDWVLSVRHELRHNKFVANQKLVQHSLVVNQLRELHLLSLQNIAHYKWQFEISLHESTSNEQTDSAEYEGSVTTERETCCAYRQHLDMSTQDELQQRDRLYEAVLSPHVSNLLHQHNGMVYRQLVLEISRDLWRRTHASVSARSFCDYRHSDRFGFCFLRLREDTLVETVEKTLLALPLEPSESDWSHMREALAAQKTVVHLRRQQLPAVQRDIDQTSVLTMAALDVLRHHRRQLLRAKAEYSAQDDAGDRHCYGCWLRVTGALRQLSFHLYRHAKLLAFRELAVGFRAPPFAVVRLPCFSSFKSFRSKLADIDATMMPKCFNVGHIVHFQPALRALLLSRGYTRCAAALRETNCAPWEIFLVHYTCDTAALESIRDAVVVCAVTQCGNSKQWTARELFHNQIEETARLLAEWTTVPESPLYAGNADVIGVLLEWLVGVDFGGLLRAAQHRLASYVNERSYYGYAYTLPSYEDVMSTQVFDVHGMLRRALRRQMSASLRVPVGSVQYR